MIRDAFQYSVVVALLILLATLVKPGPGRLEGAIFSFLIVALYFLAALLLFRYKGNSAITLIALAQIAYIIKLGLLALILFLVFRFFGDRVDREWFGVSTILTASAWLAGEIRGFFRIRYIFDSHDE